MIAVLAINASMFAIELGAGLAAHSTALLGDSLDMLGDARVYGFSLYVLHRSATRRARAAALKGILIANSFVLAAAALVARLDSLWADVVVGVGIALLLLRSALSVLRESMSELARARQAPLGGTT